jgi:3-hydroxyisobutyrate dehydrogenase
MGSGLARNLRAAGHTVTIWNRTPATAEALSAEIGASVEGSPAAAVAAAEVALACVADDEASATVWLDPDGGGLAALPPKAIAIEASTLSPDWVRRLGAVADAHGIKFLETPMVGSRPQLAARQLVHLCGGDQTVLDEARELLSVSASRIEHVGTTGNAATIKLAINGLLAVQAAVGAELLAVLANSPADVGATIELLTSLPTTSPALARLLGLMRRREFAPNFPIRLVAKDLNYLAEVAQHAAVETPMLATALSRFRAAEAAGLAEIDIAGIAEPS